jgi:hypothetical protein
MEAQLKKQRTYAIYSAWGGLSAGLGRTVCMVKSDRPQIALEPPALHLKKWTVYALPVDRPHGRDRAHSPCGPSGKP